MRQSIVRALAVVVVALATTVSACGSDTEFNKADVTFAQEMIPHHRQATEMAAMAPSRTQNGEVLALAKQIEKAQDPEIETMTGWLEDWGEKVPDSMNGMAMPGMMSDDRMADLEGSTDASFDKTFLVMMIEHHQGAVRMATDERTEGENPEARDLAADIVDTQTAEIDKMQRLLEDG